ncbi:MAG: hydrogenobyrinic acid a,c-diamide synthase (glutamine-hydrolyzing), partial [Thermoproteus sp.]|nr:hydrogenobyrinic acid a,c-diamide synthase (glutamine-hydrolyzing) [Thermoproteus sp.]
MAPRIIISSFKGLSGKTIISTALIYGLSKRGLRVAPFKVGPDYIDPSYHYLAAGVPSRNLDVFLMGIDGVLRRFSRYSKGADVAVVEGVMGLHDSMDGVSELGSTAQVAKALRAPVILILNGERVNRTLRAVVRGLKEFDKEVQIPAVVLTNIAGRQAEKLGKSLAEEGVEVVGWVPRDEEVAEVFSYRHLGLVPARERGEPERLFSLFERKVLPYLDMDKVLEIAKSADELDGVEPLDGGGAAGGCRIGIFLDRAFNFYYPEVLERAKELGEVFFVDATKDQKLPEADLLVIGGGFPETSGELLERNKPLRAEVRRYVERGGALYAECGGLMYSASSVIYNGEQYEMAGIVEGDAVVLKRPVGHGYAIARVAEDSLIGPAGAEIKGHEFHYSKLILREK